jgi:hypothetical protein
VTPAPVRAVLLALVVVLAGAGTVFADVSVATSGQSVDSSVTTAAADDAVVDLSGPVAVHVVGDTGADADLGRAVVAALRDRGVDATLVPAVAAESDRPVLVVAAADRTLNWWVVGGDATVRVRALYVQSGDLTQFGESSPGAGDFDPARLGARVAAGDVRGAVLDGPDAVRTVEVTLVDETSGFVTLASYDRQVNAATATAAVAALVRG